MDVNPFHLAIRKSHIKPVNSAVKAITPDFVLRNYPVIFYVLSSDTHFDKLCGKAVGTLDLIPKV